MYKIIDRRSTGKTTRLICLAKEYGAIIVTDCPKYIIMKCEELGFAEPVETISSKDFLARSTDGKKYLIDDLSHLLYQLCPDIIGYTESFETYINGELAYFREE